jgi:hypothetical protein
MKASEFINELKLNVPVSKKPLSGVIPQLSYLGNGIQAIAYAVKNNPNIIMKMVAISGTNDPSYQFLRLCYNHPNNPFFPNIHKFKLYNLKQFSDTDLEWFEKQHEFFLEPNQSHATHQLLIVMERLYDYPDNGAELLCNNLGIIDIVNKADPIGKYPIYARFAKSFANDELRNQMRKETSNKYFSQALRLLEPLFRNHQFEPDMHFNNIMRRKNGQAVIIDPITRKFEEE